MTKRRKRKKKCKTIEGKRLKEKKEKMQNERKRRLKGTGSIFKKKNGIYYIQYTIDGNKIVKTLHTRNKSEATERAAKILPDATVLTREDVVAKTAEIKRLKTMDRVKLAEVWMLFLKSKLRRQGTSPGTLANYERMYKRFYSWLRENYPKFRTLSEITAAIADEYAQDLDTEELNAVTYNYHIGALGTITKALMRLAGLSENVWGSLPRKQRKSIGKKALTHEEIKKLLGVFADDTISIPDKQQLEILFCIGTYTGMRLCDCALLKWEHIDFTKNLLSLYPRKTTGFNKKIKVPLHDELKNKLKEAFSSWHSEDNPYVIPNIAARYIRRKGDIIDTVLDIFRLVGIEPTSKMDEKHTRKRKANQYGFHSFRHTFCSECASNGMNINTLSEITGDSCRTLEKYYITIREDVIQKSSQYMLVLKPTEEIKISGKTKSGILAELENAPDLTDRERLLLTFLQRS